MKRRHLVVLVSAFTLLTIIFVAAVTIGVGVGTDQGREQIRSLIQQQVGSRVQGKIHIGRISGGFLAGFTIDSFAIRDRRDSLFVSTGRVKVEYDLRDLFDRRLLLRNVEVEHPLIRLEQHQERDWNFQRIFKSSGPSGPDAPGRSFGDYVVLENVRVRDGQFLLTRPWTPDDSLRGAKRDSAIRVNLANPNREIRRTNYGYAHTYRWSKAFGVLPRIRIADPDSNRFGQMFVIDKLDVEEQEPPFSFRNGRGTVKKLGDSVFVDVRHFDLPASTGSARGKIWWGSKLPTRIDVQIRGDSVSLKDVAWVYETLPRTGGGFTNLRIRNNPANLDDFRYELTGMDVRSTKSRLTGAMTFVVGGPVLEVVDVDLRGAPVNFDLVRTLAGEPLPVDWQGDLFGHVRGPGGPLTHFVVDESDVTWRDTHVRGAVSRFSGRGELDILDPEFTKFHGFQVNVASLDLRSIEFLYPEFPRIGGTIAGAATLDSVWLDVRFSKADVTHRNGPGDPSRVTGSGRVTTGDDFMSYDVAVNAQPLSLTMMSRAYPLGLKGLVGGPIQAKGTSNDLQVNARLEGPAGRISYNGKVDLYPLSVAARGTGRVDALDLAQFVDKPNAPSGWITGAFQLDVRGDTNDLGTLTGVASAQVERAEIDSIRVFPSRISARFADGRMFVDTLNVESVAATIKAAGALGLTSRSSDSLRYHVVVDSLGGLRRYVTRLTSSWQRPTGVAADSIAGLIVVSGVAGGSLESLSVTGDMTGSNLFIRREAGREVTGSFALTNVLSAPTGTASIRVSGLNVGRIALDTLGLLARFESARHGIFTLGARATNGVAFTASGDLATAGDTTDITMRDVSMVLDSSRWALRGPASIRLRGAGVEIDSLVMGNGRGGRVAIAGFVPDSGKGRMLMRADSVPMRDIGQIAQLPKAKSGWAHLTLQGAGTSLSPIMNVQARLDDVVYGKLELKRVTATGEYVNKRAEVAVDLAHGNRPTIVARASLPVEMKYFGMQLLEDPLRGSIRTDSASLAIIEAFGLPLSDPQGRLVANIDIGGTWKHPDLSGPIRVQDGQVKVDSLGVTLTGVNIDLALFGHSDSLAINRFVARSGPAGNDSLFLRGYIAYRDRENPYLSLRLDARAFNVFDKRSVARLFVSTEPAGLRLRGQLRGATLTGGIVVDRGTIFLPDPEIARKRLVDLTYDIADTSNVVRETLGEATSPFLSHVLFDGVRVTLGDEVFLRSREANIKLGGTLSVQRTTRVRRETGLLVERDEPVILLDGVLRAERGTYTLALDPLGALRREFQVESGTIRFFGTSGLEPELDISALHTVRRATGDDLRIRVRLTGPLYPNPIVTLESAESFALSQSDLVSYLVFGQPNFEIGAQGQENIQLAIQTLYPSFQSFARDNLSDWLGPLSGILQLRPGSTDLGVRNESAGNAFGNAFTNVFLTTRVGAEKQITDNVFVSVSTPICQFGNGQGEQGNGEYFVSGLSGKIEWRLSRDASVKAGKEPSATVCGRSTGRIVPTPSQWGLSLFKSWRF